MRTAIQFRLSETYFMRSLNNQRRKKRDWNRAPCGRKEVNGCVQSVKCNKQQILSDLFFGVGCVRALTRFE